MAKPSFSQIFGNGSIIIDDETDVPAAISPTNPALLIPFSALSSGNLTVLASMADPEKVLLAIMNNLTSWYQSDNTEDPVFEATAVREATGTRRNQRMRSYSFELTAYRPLAATPTIDPDTIDIVE